MCQKNFFDFSATPTIFIQHLIQLIKLIEYILTNISLHFIFSVFSFDEDELNQMIVTLSATWGGSSRGAAGLQLSLKKCKAKDSAKRPNSP